MSPIKNSKVVFLAVSAVFLAVGGFLFVNSILSRGGSPGTGATSSKAVGSNESMQKAQLARKRKIATLGAGHRGGRRGDSQQQKLNQLDLPDDEFVSGRDQLRAWALVKRYISLEWRWDAGLERPSKKLRRLVTARHWRWLKAGPYGRPVHYRFKPHAPKIVSLSHPEDSGLYLEAFQDHDPKDDMLDKYGHYWLVRDGRSFLVDKTYEDDIKEIKERGGN